MSRFLKIIFFIGIGFVAGAYLFSQTQPRTFVTLHDCKPVCLSTSELLGLLTSVGIQRLPHPESAIIMETDKTVVVQHPYSEAPIHYLVLPKKDIRNIVEASLEDQSYIMDAFAVIKKIVDERKLAYYQVITNGPGLQQVDYLHFHLMAWTDKNQLPTSTPKN
ncbi:MAG TPA: HIT domain-containing protein [Patescibacteria group bacterium]|nr:HIT domain-containing protein [Patescibacteria group bacterium]